MLMRFLFHSNRLNTSGNFVIISILVIQASLFPLNKKKMKKWSFLDIKVSPKKKFVATVYRNHTFGGANNHFESFLPTVNKFDMIYTLNNRCFKIFSDWTTFHAGLRFLKEDFLKNGYPLSFNFENIVLKHFLISCS